MQQQDTIGLNIRTLLSAGMIICVLLLVLIVLAGVTGVMPRAVSRCFWGLAFRHLSTAPRHGLELGTHGTLPVDKRADISLAVFDGGEPAIFGARPGGDAFEFASRQKFIDLRINAVNGRDAATYLRERFVRDGFAGGIRNICIYAHGAPGRANVGLQPLEVDDELFVEIAKHQPREGLTEVYIIECSVASGEKGRQYIQRIADTHNLRVIASTAPVIWKPMALTTPGECNHWLDRREWLVAAPNGGEPRPLEPPHE